MGSPCDIVPPPCVKSGPCSCKFKNGSSIDLSPLSKPEVLSRFNITYENSTYFFSPCVALHLGNDSRPESCGGGVARMVLTSPSACVTDASPSDPSSSGLSTGSILLLICLGGILFYLIGGMAYMNLVRGAEGVDMIPHYAFWKEFPLLVRDIYENLSGPWPSEQGDSPLQPAGPSLLGRILQHLKAHVERLKSQINEHLSLLSPAEEQRAVVACLFGVEQRETASLVAGSRFRSTEFPVSMELGVLRLPGAIGAFDLELVQESKEALAVMGLLHLGHVESTRVQSSMQALQKR
ncbi:unnamed protein product [Cyprideis torosa]|uniref:Uncharacterized protein n=1 Tax=Cyprideis torosa TaxID=163714 RepID=A0A7R8ZJ08_9CRUS|nr:unnamed protein product [Cyprideis torosa]CAG0885906.1 unnamed protein product [Cyprideis torosa]